MQCNVGHGGVVCPDPHRYRDTGFSNRVSLAVDVEFRHLDCHATRVPYEYHTESNSLLKCNFVVFGLLFFAVSVSNGEPGMFGRESARHE